MFHFLILIIQKYFDKNYLLNDIYFADGLVRKKQVQRQGSADSSFPAIINVDEDMVMV